MDRERIVTAIEGLIAPVDLEKLKKSEKQMQVFTSLIIEYCFVEAAKPVQERQAETKQVTTPEDIKEIIALAHSIWCLIEDYLRDTHDFIFPPAAFEVSLVKSIDNFSSDSIQDRTIREGISLYVQELVDKSKEELEAVNNVEVVPVKDIENYGGDPKELVDAFFVMLGELGTFYRDRSNYETEDKRKIHDKLVAISQKLSV